eukprot:CAMPEP_0201248114 /NCGR_PEP_ID=MMETSP0852-20130820/55657_1 /ASSEMBLY_ACC=CAM_ASM_000632 /TAXON_ID=183588 /ORGANISM="Pseudo-nitzschia fraudulenta, Strain WWA7" /LENGTH=37 /DNA_ID= /DNA_START= /DNA_END= /DNA_ORIENTATION=
MVGNESKIATHETVEKSMTFHKSQGVPNFTSKGTSFS